MTCGPGCLICESRLRARAPRLMKFEFVPLPDDARIVVPACTCGQGPSLLDFVHADDCAIRVPDELALRERIRALESKAHPPQDLLEPVAVLIEQHPLVRELRARAESAESRLVDLERRVAELWRRAM